MRLNLGCGRNHLEGWVNVDSVALPSVDVVADLDRCREVPLPFADDSVDELLLSHVLEHVGDTLALMQELHRIAKPGSVAVVRCPYGSSDDADEDPTHRHRFFVGSFGYFSQPYYWRADYGYRGDWEPRRILLRVHRDGNAGLSPQQIMGRVNAARNVVAEMVVDLVAVKPIRAADRALQRPLPIEIALA